MSGACQVPFWHKANGDRVYHCFNNIDSLGVSGAYLPDELKKRGLTAAQKQRLIWLSWTKIFLPFMKDANLLPIIANKQGVTFGTFKKCLIDPRSLKNVEWRFS